jgi:hypothetical protein
MPVLDTPLIARPVMNGHIRDEHDNVVWSGPVLAFEEHGKIVCMIPFRPTMDQARYWTLVLRIVERLQHA